MNYTLEITRKAEKDLKAIPKCDQAKIHVSILALKHDLRGDVKKIVNHEPEYRCRVGDWRILFAIENGMIIIARILNRKDAYRS